MEPAKTFLLAHKASHPYNGLLYLRFQNLLQYPPLLGFGVKIIWQKG